LNEVEEHERINTENSILLHQSGRTGSLSFYDTLKDKFLIYLGMYLDELKIKSR